MGRLVVILASALIACPVLAEPQGVGFAVRIQTRPDDSIDRLVEWVDAVLTHVPGNGDRPITIVSAWTPKAVNELRIDIDSLRRLMRDPDIKAFPLLLDFDRSMGTEIRYSGSQRRAMEAAAGRARERGLSDADLVARGIVLHSDIALLGRGSGDTLVYTDGQGIDLLRSADHWAMARALADSLDSKAGRHPDLAFWYRATLAEMVLKQNWNASHAERAVDKFGDDAELSFLVACLHESLSMPRTQTALANGQVPSTITVRVRSAQGELDQATSSFKRALELNPQHVEARVHYGRVLTLSGKAEAGLAELRRAAAGVTEPAQRYYTHLFIGAALEATNQAPAARAAYQAAAALFPQAQVPRLALGHLAFGSGSRGDATEAIAPLLALPADEDDRVDPWWTYSMSCGRTAPALLTEARQRLATPRAPSR